MLNLKGTPEALLTYNQEKNVKLLEKFKVLNRQEINARMEIQLENYCKILNIEARTMMEMTNRDILPACIKFMDKLASEIRIKHKVDIEANCEKEILKKVSTLTDDAYNALQELTVVSKQVKLEEDIEKRAKLYREKLLGCMTTLRTHVDNLEKIVAKEDWPFPSYCDILYSV